MFLRSWKDNDSQTMVGVTKIAICKFAQSLPDVGDKPHQPTKHSFPKHVFGKPCNVFSKPCNWKLLEMQWNALVNAGNRAKCQLTLCTQCFSHINFWLGKALLLQGDGDEADSNLTQWGWRSTNTFLPVAKQGCSKWLGWVGFGSTNISTSRNHAQKINNH